MAGRLNLAVTGIQDQWLTGDPEFSYFLMNFKRHTKFSIEAIETPFDGDIDYDATVECRIPKNKGDVSFRITFLFLDKLNQIGLRTFTSLPSSNKINKLGLLYVTLTSLSEISKTVPYLAIVLPGA